MFIATLFVTVPETDAETAVDTSTFPVDAGSVTVLDPATAGAEMVTEPDVLPARTTEAIVFP
jgi:hypothetical protein